MRHGMLAALAALVMGAASGCCGWAPPMPGTDDCVDASFSHCCNPVWDFFKGEVFPTQHKGHWGRGAPHGDGLAEEDTICCPGLLHHKQHGCQVCGGHGCQACGGQGYASCTAPHAGGYSGYGPYQPGPGAIPANHTQPAGGPSGNDIQLAGYNQATPGRMQGYYPQPAPYAYPPANAQPYPRPAAYAPQGGYPQQAIYNYPANGQPMGYAQQAGWHHGRRGSAYGPNGQLPPVQMAPGMSAATVGYPYYTTRGPRDFFRNNPPSIGP